MGIGQITSVPATSNTIKQISAASSTLPMNPHQAFMESAFYEGMTLGILAVIVRNYTRTLANEHDFDIKFNFVKNSWHIEISPKTNLGAFTISELKETCIKAELSGKEDV